MVIIAIIGSMMEEKLVAKYDIDNPNNYLVIPSGFQGEFNIEKSFANTYTTFHSLSFIYRNHSKYTLKKCSNTS